MNTVAKYSNSDNTAVLPTGYKKTEVGVIPKDWDVKSLVKLCTPKCLVRGPFGGALKKEFFVESGFKVYEQRNAIYKSCDIGSYFITPTKFNEMQRFSIEPGDFIISCSGTIGRIYQIPPDATPGIINQALLKIRVDERVVYDKFFYLVFEWNQFQARIIDSTQGGAMQNLVGMDIFKNTQVVLPPKPEQRAIATALSDVDGLIEALDKLIAKKRAIKFATMQQLLSGKTHLPGFSGEWETKRLGAVLCYEQPTEYLVRSSEYNDNNDIAVLTANKSFVLGYTDENDNVFKNVPAVIFDDFTTASKYVDFPFKVKSSALKILKLRNKCNDLQFIFEKMQLIRFPLGDHKRYWISEYQHIEIEVPSFEEQTAIATVLSDMDAEIAALEWRREKTESIKQGMMQALLTGRVRLVNREASA